MKKLLAILIIMLICLISLTVFCQETTINKNQKAINMRLGLGCLCIGSGNSKQ
jgi:hypothetical protein